MTHYTAMNRQDFIQLIEEKGCKPEDWPAQLRPQIDELLSSDQKATAVLSQYRELEQLLRQLPVPDLGGLNSRVARQDLPQRPASLLDTLLNWLFPSSGSGLVWRPAVLACLPFFFGIVMSSYFNFGIDSDPLQQNWDDELAMLSLTDYSQNQIEL